MPRKTIILAFVSFFIQLQAFSQFTFGKYVLHEVNIIDVVNERIVENQTIVVDGDRIINILDSDNYTPSDSIQLIKLSGKYLMPGLIDAHVHMATDASEEIRANAEKDLEDMLRTGITSVRDMAGDARALSSLSRDALVGDIDAPNVYYSSLMACLLYTSPSPRDA